MTTQEPGGTRPGRAIGLLLMGIAVIAAILGVITLIDEGNGGNPAAPPPFPPSSTAPAPPAPPPPSGSQPNPSPSSPPPSQQPPPGGPTGAPPPTPQPPPPAQPNPRAVPVRVYNNGTISGLAADAAEDFRGAGWDVVEVGNYSEGIIPTSTVYFRPGTDEEAAARLLGGEFNIRAEARFEGIANSAPGLIVLLTNDYGGK